MSLKEINMIQVKLPEIGEGVNEATVSFWHCKEGNEVKKDEDLVELYTDKANFQIQVPVPGILKRIYKKEDEKIQVGEVLAEIEEGS